MADPTVLWIAAVALGGLLGSASFGKLADRAHFRASVEAYRLLPAAMVGLVSTALPVIELVAATCLLVPALRGPGGWLAAGLLACYATAMAVNLSRGRSNLDCGCFGPARRERIAGWMVARNVLLSAVALGVAMSQISRPLEPLDWLTVAAGSVTVGCLYVATETLARNGLRNRSALS